MEARRDGGRFGGDVWGLEPQPHVTLPLPGPVAEGPGSGFVKAICGGTLKIPLYGDGVAAGFPSPATDFIERTLDANDYLVDNPTSTFFLRASGDSMTGAGIEDGDMLVVDKSVDPVPGKIVIAAVGGGEFTVKRLAKRRGKCFLRPENPKYSDIVPAEGEELIIFGVVVGKMRRFEPRK